MDFEWDLAKSKIISVRRAQPNERKTITAEEFDKKFDDGEDVTEHLVWSKAVKKINIDFPLWMVKSLDDEADRLQIPRQAVIKMWLDERLQKMESERAVTKAV